MDDIVNQNAVDHLFELFALATALIVFWVLENVWRTDRRWLIPIIIFPCSIFLYIINHWEENRAKCFFGGLILFLMLIVGGLVGFSFFSQILALFKLVAFWPYYAFEFTVEHAKL